MGLVHAERPGGGIAEALADVLAPAAGAAGHVGRAERAQPLFGGPTEFALGAPQHLVPQQFFPLAADWVAEPDPDEVEELMESDAGQLVRIRPESLIQHNPPVAEEACGVNFLARPGAEAEPAAPGMEVSGPLDADGRSLETGGLPRAQAYFFGEPVSMYCGSRTSNWTLF